MDVDNDLYPPDIEVVTPAARHARNRAAIGTFLVTLGTGLMLERIVGRDLDVFWMGVGFALIAAWLQAPQFWWFVAGATIAGMGFGGFLESLVSMPFETTLGSLCSAAGFFAVFVRYPQRAKWALVPALVILAFGALAGAVAVIGLVPAALGSLGVPGLLIAGGVLLLVRNTLPPLAVKVGIVVIGIMLISSLVSTVDSWDGSRIGDEGPPVLFDPPGPPRPFAEATADLPDLDGRTLVVATNDGAIRLDTTIAPTGSVLVSNPDRRGSIAVATTSETVTVSWSGRGGDDIELVVTVPEGSRVRAMTDDGRIDATVDRGDFTFEADDGSVDVTFDDDDDALVDVQTDDGTITVDGEDKGDNFSTKTRGDSGTPSDDEAGDDTISVRIRMDDGTVNLFGLAA